MAIADFIDDEKFVRHLQAHTKERMIKAAEPVIQEAMKEVEAKLRESLGAVVVGLMEKSFSIERLGHDLRITVINTQGGNKR